MADLVHQHVVALTPADVPQAQQSLATWCKQKVLALSRELREQQVNLRQAKAAKWKHLPWVRQVGKTKARMIYYTKIRRAVEAGYLIVPNFDCEVMAVRVVRAQPVAKSETLAGHYISGPSNDLVRTPTEVLPPGVGRYVDDQLFYDESTWTEKRDGKDVEQHHYQVTRYDLPDFPMLAVKPAVLDATERAMALNLFDRIGVVTGRKRDPLVIGEIVDPATNRRWLPSSQKRVSFFIAWWLNTEDL